MPTFYEEIERYLLELNAETLNQLAAVKAQEPDRFLQSTEKCSSIMNVLDGLQLQKTLQTDESRLGFKEILLEIAEIRDQVSELVQPFYEKIKQKADAEKQSNFVKRRYNFDNKSFPSIFLDKKV